MSVIARDGRFSNDDIDTYGCFVIVISNSALHQNGQTIFFYDILNTFNRKFLWIDSNISQLCS